MSRGTVLVISLSDLGSDPRVDRQIDFLRGEHRVVTAGFGPPPYDDVEHVQLRSRRSLTDRVRAGTALVSRILATHEHAYWAHPDHRSWRALLVGIEPDVVLVNDAITLPLAFSIGEGKPVVLDAHEYAPVEWETSLAWRVTMRRHIQWIWRNYLPRASALTAVGPEIASRLERDTGIETRVVTNTPRFEELSPSEVGGTIRLVHFGWPDPMRRLGDTLAAMKLLGEDYSIDLVLMTPESLQGELEKLRDLAGGDPQIRFLDPVPMRDLPRFANEYDVGVHLLPPATFNQKFALPNKFFEYIQARIAPAIGPSPEMARVLGEWDCGIVATDYTPEALAGAIAATTRERLAQLKQNTDRAARELCAERNRPIVLDSISKALQPAGAKRS